MKTFVIYYTCPHCKASKANACGSNPLERANECVYANTKAEAKAIFTAYKPCRWQKIAEIKEVKW